MAFRVRTAQPLRSTEVAADVSSHVVRRAQLEPENRRAWSAESARETSAQFGRWSDRSRNRCNFLFRRRPQSLDGHWTVFVEAQLVFVELQQEINMNVELPLMDVTASFGLLEEGAGRGLPHEMLPSERLSVTAVGTLRRPSFGDLARVGGICYKTNRSVVQFLFY
ncbi:hypothetical protein BHM03_00038570 [Ensete ventricosum]|nr:hypothetical protein BHM03_00038570 [Ensete ventricosum]